MINNHSSDDCKKNPELTSEVVDLSIVIVNWNSGDLLSECIKSIQLSCGYSKEAWAIVVVDNGSTDNSLEKVADVQDIYLIRAERNLGFGKACNLGVSACKSEFILFLNPDATVYESTILSALKYMREPGQIRVGICGVQLEDDFGEITHSCTRFPGPWNFLAHSVGFDRPFPKLGHFMNYWDHDQTRKVDHVIGAFFLVRRQLFDILGGFDERFFLYLEDLDFSYRASKAGWESIYLADVQAHHSGGGVSRQVKARRLFYSLRSNLVYSFKHFSWAEWVIVLFSTLVLEFVSRVFYALLRRSWLALNETLVAYMMLWRWLPRWILNGSTD